MSEPREYASADEVRSAIVELTRERDKLAAELELQDDANEILTRQLAEAREANANCISLSLHESRLAAAEAELKNCGVEIDRYMRERDQARAEVERLKDVCKDLNRERNTTFNQSCINRQERDRYRLALERIASEYEGETPHVPTYAAKIAREALSPNSGASGSKVGNK